MQQQKPKQQFVPVVDKNQVPLMPTTPARASRWVKSGKATPFWKRGVFCVRLNVEPSDRKMQDVVVGVDPGAKKEAFTVKSRAYTFLNVQADSMTWVKNTVEQRRQMRRGRRYRHGPCRSSRYNRARGGIPPSTRARWGWKLRALNWLGKMFPVVKVVVEDIKATTKQWQKTWNRSFSPLEVGKTWFYSEIEKRWTLTTFSGWETKQMRDGLGIKKTGNKQSDRFEAHCVDSWVLANSQVPSRNRAPENKEVLHITPIRLHRRQLHRLQPEKGGIRKPYGGTRSLGFTRGSYVRHPKWGLAYVGGCFKDRISLHCLETGKRLTQNAKPADCQALTYASWRFRTARFSAA